MEKLKTLVSKPVPGAKIGETALLEIWDEAIAPKIDPSHSAIFRNYILKLYDPDMNYSYWPMNRGMTRITIDTVHVIVYGFKKLIENGTRDSLDVVQSNLSVICNAIQNYCPDRQFTELRLTYNLLNGTVVGEDVKLAEFVSSFLAMRKESMFDFVVTPVYSGQNVHVLSFWKNQLKDVLGFDFNFRTGSGTMDQDPFFGEHGNVLNAFFNLFKPDLLIELLTEEIDSNNRMKCQAVELIYKLDTDLDAKKGMVEASDFDNMLVEKVKRSFVEYYLIEQGYLERIHD